MKSGTIRVRLEYQGRDKPIEVADVTEHQKKLKAESDLPPTLLLPDEEDPEADVSDYAAKLNRATKSASKTVAALNAARGWRGGELGPRCKCGLITRVFSPVGTHCRWVLECRGHDSGCRRIWYLPNDKPAEWATFMADPAIFWDWIGGTK